MNKRQFTLWNANMLMSNIAARGGLAVIKSDDSTGRVSANAFDIAENMANEAEKRGLFNMEPTDK